MIQSQHELSAHERAYTDLGRKIIQECENNTIFPKDDEESLTLWNSAVTAANKFMSFGTTWSKFQGIDDLSKNERLAVKKYLNGTACD
jgi:hypothetical protein